MLSYFKWYSSFILIINNYNFIIIAAVFNFRHFQSLQSSVIMTFEQQNFQFLELSMITWRSCLLLIINNNVRAFNLSNCIVLSIFRLFITYKFANIRSNVIKSSKTNYFIKSCRLLRFRNMMKIQSSIRTLSGLFLIKYQIVIQFILTLVTDALSGLL